MTRPFAVLAREEHPPLVEQLLPAAAAFRGENGGSPAGSHQDPIEAGRESHDVDKEPHFDLSSAGGPDTSPPSESSGEQTDEAATASKAGAGGSGGKGAKGAGSSKRRKKESKADQKRPKGGTGAGKGRPSPSHPGFLGSVHKHITANLGAYKQGPWAREPWSTIPYEQVAEYRTPADLPEEEAAVVTRKLGTTLPENWMANDTQVALKAHDSLIDISSASHEPLRLGVDIEQRSLWGIDGHTRQAIVDVLLHVPGMTEAEQRNAFIERGFLPAANSLGDRGWDVLAVLEVMEEGADDLTAAAIGALRKVVVELDQRPPKKTPKDSKRGKAGRGSQPQGDPRADPAAAPSGDGANPATRRGSFRLHPKGLGIVCLRKEGIPRGTFIADYLGEIYPPWRWYERQDALKKLNPQSELPDFYNVTLEVPDEDEGGFDVLFIEAACKSTVASRLSHSCTPNCTNIPTVRNGKHVISMYTSRDVRFGEELCWDYACITESQKEYQAAVCLCGTSQCRGSFLYYAGTGAFAEILNRRHGFLERNALLARAVTEPLLDSDCERLTRNGVKGNALKSSSGATAPSWLLKWAALVMEYVELEVEWVVEWLLADPKHGYTPETARIEANGVKRNRIFNIVTTLDKVKYCISKQPNGVASPPPLNPLTDEEVCKYLWNAGEESIAGRCLAAVTRFFMPRAVTADGKAGSMRGSQLLEGVDEGTQQSFLSMQELAQQHLSSPKEVYASMRQLSLTVRAMGSSHHGMADVLLMYSSTRRWFRACSIEIVKSPPVSFEGDSRVTTLAQAGRQPEKILSRMYRGQYCWGQLVSWYKQTIYNPEASLSAERRGTMSLPDPESAYGRPEAYAATERFDLLDLIEKSPNQYFPVSMIWSFKNKAKVYGSPQLDSAIARSHGKPDPLPKLLREMRAASPQQRSSGARGGGRKRPAGRR